MKAPTKVTLAFDPDEAGLASFTSDTAKIIWCCIRKQHIVHQHFDSQVFGFAEYLDENMPDDYGSFKSMVACTDLRVFGICYTGTPMEQRCCSHRELDDEFWQGVWEYIKGRKKLEVEILPPKEAPNE